MSYTKIGLGIIIIVVVLSTIFPRTIEVTGTEGLRYSGNYGTLMTMKSVDGMIPYNVGSVTYDNIGSGSLVAVFQKQDARGTLTVKIKRAGITLKQSTTRASYGAIDVTD